jgi:chromosome segregation ATPase
MSGQTIDASETVVPFARVARNGVTDDGDLLDSAGRTILGLLHRAAGMAEENSQHALGVAHKLSLQLRAAEDRIKDLEADVRHYQDRADRAEKWLYQISEEIDQRFFKPTDGRPAQAPPRQVGPQAYARKT